jgi:DNA-binding transcriptional LysR family regulator
MQDNMQFLEANKYLIRYYYVYKHKSFHRAAEFFYISSTDRNMKYAVTQLEELYDIQLVKVEGNKLNFTEFGHVLGELSKKVFDTNIEIHSVLKRTNLEEIRFATSHDFFKYYIKPIFENFQKENPDAKVRILKTNQDDSTARLLRHEIDFVVGTVPMKQHPDLTYYDFSEGKMLLMVQKDREKEFTSVKSLADLAGLRGGMKDSTDAFHANFQKSCAGLDEPLNIMYETSDYESLVDIVRSGHVDYVITGNYYIHDDLAYIDISHLFEPVKIAFIYRKGEDQTLAIDKLVEISQQMKVKPIHIE